MTTPALVLSLALLGTVGSDGAGGVEAAASGAHESRATCDPQLLMLPGLTSTSQTRVTAISDSGLVVGTSRAGFGTPSTAVVWTDPEHVIDTGVGGVVLDSGHELSASAVDVNEAGLVAINLTTFTRRGRLIAEDAVVWSEGGGATVLRASAARPRASLSAINDEGDVVGAIRGGGHGNVPVIWSDGKRSKLPAPRRTDAFPADINNEGLVVGTLFNPRPSSASGAWVWQVGHDSGPLKPPAGRGSANPTEVDNSGRIVGNRSFVGPAEGIRSFLWRNRDARPRRLVPLQTFDLHNSGFLAASSPGFRGIDARAYVGHRRDGIRAQLPAPPNAGGTIEWANVRALAVARGTSAFAPQGGVTIGGNAEDFESISQATLWTCTQSLS